MGLRVRAVASVLTFALLSAALSGRVEGQDSRSKIGSQATPQISANSADQLSLAKAYKAGNGVQKNPSEAARRLQELSDQGVTEASALLGQMYLYGAGIPQDLPRAEGLIRAAALKGEGVGLRLLGEMYEMGKGVPQDYKQAVTFYSKAMEKGESNAFDRLALMYMGGRGVGRNLGMAFQLFSQGAALGDPWAQVNLARMYESGRQRTGSIAINQLDQSGVKARFGAGKPDYAMALKLYQDAALQGNRTAEFRLGQMFEEGKGVEEDYGKAIDHYSRSASKFYGPALNALGRCYELGRGTDVDLVGAYAAYSLAIAQNNLEASERIRVLMPRLTPDQVVEARKSLQDIEARHEANRILTH